MTKTKWDKTKRDCRNCKHFYVCDYKSELKNALEKHLFHKWKWDGAKVGEETIYIVNELAAKYCKYFDIDCYSNTYNMDEEKD